MERRVNKTFFDLISFGGFLIIVGLTFFLYPQIPSAIIAFFETLSQPPHVFRPPRYLSEAAATFFTMIGVLNFVIAGMRLAAGWPWQNSLKDAFSGIALLFLGYLLRLYSEDTITGWLVWPSFLIVVGILIAVNGFIQYYYAPRKRP